MRGERASASSRSLETSECTLRATRVDLVSLSPKRVVEEVKSLVDSLAHRGSALPLTNYARCARQHD
jgi:hypothetical protein